MKTPLPDYAIPPGETLRETMEARGITARDLAAACSMSEARIVSIVAGEWPITEDTAIRLEKALGVPASLWHDLERNYRAALARSAEIT